MKNFWFGLLLSCPWLAVVTAASIWAFRNDKLMSMLETITSVYVAVIYTVSVAAILLLFFNLAGAGYKVIFRKGK